MKNKYFFFSLVFLVSLFVGLKLFNPDSVIACLTADDCVPPPISCTADSKTCDNGVCKFTWNCTNTCPAWTAWSPDPCTTGSDQTRFCVEYEGVYQIQRCGASSFMAGTIVSTPLGGKKIEDLKVGDRVISFADDALLESVVSKTHKVRRDYYFDLVAGDYKVKVTAKHPFYIGNNEFKTAEELKAGDNVYVMEKKSLVKKRVTSKTKVNQKADVYNLTVDGTNTYFAAGFAVHNKGSFVCNERKVDCPTGYTRTNTVSSLECKGDYGGTAAWCYGIGTAQAVTGCCDNWKRCEDEPDPEKTDCCSHGNDQITTYACVPTCTPSCSAPLCGQSDGCGGTCANTGASSWGAWSACNTSCGGGTQIRYNACGTPQTKSCNIQACPPWWQVKDSDVSSRRDLTSIVPTGKFFGLPGPGGYPGAAAYSGTTNLTSAKVSQTGWIANSAVGSPKVYDYRYFANLLPADTVISTLSSNVLDQTAIDANTTPSYGYYWYRYDGSVSGLDLKVDSTLTIGSKKVVVMVNSSDFAVNARVNLTDGVGFFLVVVNGNITVDPSVSGGTPDLEGLYVADGTFSSGLSSLPLNVRGSVVAYGGLSLQRDLGSANNSSSPSEFFEYAPDQIMLFPRVLGSRKMNWKEVAP